MSQNEQKCASNPDVAGLGIRISIYIHAGLVVIQYFVVFVMHRTTPNGGLRRLNMQVLFLSGALMLSALIRALTVGLSVYHMLLVLNLSWINGLALSLPFIFRAPRTSWQLGFVGHVVVQCSLGIWMWATVNKFGQNSGCGAKGTDFILFGIAIPATDSGLRDASIVIYTSQLLLSFYIISPYFTSHLDGFLSLSKYRFRIVFAFVILPACIIIVLIVNTELMIRKNGGLFNASEKSWTLGQVLAMLLLLPPLYIFAIENAIREPEQPLSFTFGPESREFASSME